MQIKRNFSKQVLNNVINRLYEHLYQLMQVFPAVDMNNNPFDLMTSEAVIINSSMEDIGFKYVLIEETDKILFGVYSRKKDTPEYLIKLKIQKKNKRLFRYNFNIEIPKMNYLQDDDYFYVIEHLLMTLFPHWHEINNFVDWTYDSFKPIELVEFLFSKRLFK